MENIEHTLPRNGDALPLLGSVLDAIEGDDGVTLGI